MVSYLLQIDAEYTTVPLSLPDTQHDAMFDLSQCIVIATQSVAKGKQPRKQSFEPWVVLPLRYALGRNDDDL